MLQYIICYCNQCIFFAIHSSVLTDNSQTVYIRVYHKGYITSSFLHQAHDVTQVLFQRFRIMLEVASRFAIQFFHMLYAQLLQQLRQYHTTNRVYAINCHAEISLTDSFYVYQFQRQHAVNMFLVVCIVFTVLTDMFDVCKFKFFCSSNTQYLITFCRIQEFTMFIQQLQCIPLSRIMAGSQNNTTACSFHSYSKFCSRSRSQPDIYYIESHSHQRSANHIFHHFTRDTCITAHYNLI